MGSLVKRLAASLLLAGAACAHAHGCVAPKLSPTYLPAGFHRVAMRRLVPGGGSATWRDARRFVQLVSDVSANLGEDARSATVRGYTGRYGPTGLPSAPLAVEWRDRCGAPMALIARGISSDELLRIADGLRPA